MRIAPGATRLRRALHRVPACSARGRMRESRAAAKSAPPCRAYHTQLFAPAGTPALEHPEDDAYELAHCGRHRELAGLSTHSETFDERGHRRVPALGHPDAIGTIHSLERIRADPIRERRL